MAAQTHHGDFFSSRGGLRNRIPESAATILEQADRFELLSLNPRYRASARKDNFHGYKILGTTIVTDAETRKKLVTALEKGVAENQGTVAMCFNPRHGIRANRNGKQSDFVICFECDQVYVFGEGQGQFLITRSPQALFKDVLRKAGIPQAE